MRLPSLPHNAGLRQVPQDRFGGLDHREGAGDGAVYEMTNLTGDLFPLLASRRPRARLTTLVQPGGLFAWAELAWTDGDGFFYGGERRGTVSAGEKTFAALGARIVIFPDKAYYDTASGEFGSLESEWSGTGVSFTNGRLYGEKAACNTVQCTGAKWAQRFRAGDAVTISGCTRHKENNKTPVIREIDGDRLYFYENVFTLDGSDGDQGYTEPGTVTLRRAVPDLDFLCQNENRLWGCRDDTIYACKPGDPFNWNVFDGLDTDSYAVSTGSPGRFTAAVSYRGYPVFFKERGVYKVYGSIPSNFQVMGSASLGVAEGSGKSLAVAGETLFYLSPAGPAAYSGGIPQPIGKELGPGRLRNGAGGSDGLKYYLSAADEAGEWKLYVYDARTGLWHAQDDTHALGFALTDRLWLLNAQGEIWAADTEQGEGLTPEGPVAWQAVFADFTGGSPHRKGVVRLLVRLELDEGASAGAWLMFDADGQWRPAGTLTAARKRSFQLPIVPRRADSFRLKLAGTGGVRVQCITREYYAGSAR